MEPSPISKENVMKTHTIHHRLAALCLAALLCLATALPAAAAPAATRDAGPVSFVVEWMQSIYATIVHAATLGSDPEDESLSIEEKTGPLVIGNGATAEEPDNGDESSGPLAIPNGLTSEESEAEDESGPLMIPNG